MQRCVDGWVGDYYAVEGAEGGEGVERYRFRKELSDFLKGFGVEYGWVVEVLRKMA